MKYLPVQVATASRLWCWYDPLVNIVHPTHTQKWHNTRDLNKKNTTADWRLLSQKMAPGPNKNPTQSCIETWKSQNIYYIKQTCSTIPQGKITLYSEQFENTKIYILINMSVTDNQNAFIQYLTNSNSFHNALNCF